MNFREAISAIPFNPSGAMATGLVAPIMRASGHILYIVGAKADGYNLTTEEVQRELADAQAHLAGTSAVAASAPISTACRNYINLFVSAVTFASIEYLEWSEEDVGRNLKDLADRTASLGTIFDVELAGLGTSTPGRTL